MSAGSPSSQLVVTMRSFGWLIELVLCRNQPAAGLEPFLGPEPHRIPRGFPENTPFLRVRPVARLHEGAFSLIELGQRVVHPVGDVECAPGMLHAQPLHAPA